MCTGGVVVSILTYHAKRITVQTLLQNFFQFIRLKLPNLWGIVKKIVPLQKGPGKYPYFWKIELELYDSTNLKKKHIRVTSHLLL